MSEQQGEKTENGQLVEVVEVKKVINGGRRSGSGRKLGGKNASTIVREKSEKYMKERIYFHTDKLLNKQLNLAFGVSYLFKKETAKNENGTAIIKTSMVTDPEEIRQFIDGEFDDSNTEYYHISTKAPDGRSIDSLLDRGYGRAQQNVDLTGDLNVNHYEQLDDDELDQQLRELEGEPIEEITDQDVEGGEIIETPTETGS